MLVSLTSKPYTHHNSRLALRDVFLLSTLFASRLFFVANHAKRLAENN